MIQVIGLGYADEKSLPLEILQILKSGKPLWLRTEKHPVVSWLKEKGIQFHTFDHHYEEQSDFASVYDQIVHSLLRLAKKEPSLIYAVPGHPMVAERTVQLLLEYCERAAIEVEVIGGTSFLDGLFSRLKFDPIEGFALLDGTNLRNSQLNPSVHQVIGQVYSRMVASDVKLTLLEIYPAETPITIATAIGIPQLEEITTVPLYQLDHEERFTDFTSLYVPPVKDPLVVPRRFETLVYIFEYLRGPNGCPWDRKQTHESLRPFLIEEVYEFFEAVANRDQAAMEDELGDVLLQVLLHAQIAKESDAFDIYDVIENLAKKMIRRHPHVFGHQQLLTSSQVVQNWEEIKKKEKNRKESSSVLEGIPLGLPALTYAYQLQKKSAKVGFDWDRKEVLAAKITEELLELFQAKTKKEMNEEMGDLLFVVANLARAFEIDPEIALLDACIKFQKRFKYIEQKAEEIGKTLQEVGVDQMNQWWDEAKKHFAQEKEMESSSRIPK